MRGQHRAGRSEPSWRDTLDSSDPDPGYPAPGGYGHAPALRRAVQTVARPRQENEWADTAELFAALAAQSNPDVCEERHRHGAPSGLPYRLPTAEHGQHYPPPEPEPEPFGSDAEPPGEPTGGLPAGGRFYDTESDRPRPTPQGNRPPEASSGSCRAGGHPLDLCHCGIEHHVLSWFAGYVASLHEGVPGDVPTRCRCGANPCRSRELVNLLYRSG